MDDELISELMSLAYRYAYTLSDDTRTKNGAIIVSENTVLSYGVNQFPKGVVLTRDRLISPVKYSFMEHAERNAIYAAWKSGRSLEGTTMICPWFSCADCARAIVASGIKTIVGHKLRFSEPSPTWGASIDFGNTILDEGGVTRTYYDGTVDNCVGFWDGVEHRFGV